MTRLAVEANERLFTTAPSPVVLGFILFPMRILVAEDEKKIARLVRKGLAEQGYTVDVCHRGDDALAMASTEPYDAVILDIMLPGRDGLSVLRMLREKKMAVPVMFLTARGEVSARWTSCWRASAHCCAASPAKN